MINLALDKDTNDLVIENFNLQLVENLDQVEQSLKNRLLTFLQEWFLDTTAGLPFYDDILIKNPNIPDIENIIKAKIIDTPKVIELVEFNSNFDNAARSYSVTFKAKTEFGIVELTVSLFN